MNHHELLDESRVSPNPFEQFRVWYELALKSDLPEPTAVNLATVGNNGRPSSRLVLLKGFDPSGFLFFTNYDSRKGKELTSNPWAALTFWWPPLHWQVRIEGKVEMVSTDESDAYFASRPFGSQIGALASPQSERVDRATIDAKYASLLQQYQGKKISRPAHWGGIRLVPDRFEFWQGRENRLHDRIEYVLEGGGWRITRLAP